MTRIFLARHAEPEKSVGAARADGSLSRFGRSQADYLAERLLEFRPLKVVSGPSLRCKETAAFAAKRLGASVTVDQRFTEVEPPRGTPNANLWLMQNFRGDSATTWDQLDANVNKWRAENLRAIAEVKENTVVFTHFININAIVSSALHTPNTAVCRPDYASITEISVVNGDIRLVLDGTEIKGPNE
ncbi:MAG: histidine phosphatase family protein [Proteobacteria bacterium]|nr:histidine phosphatase family protein [Pseudomonadota bacterium]